MVFKNIDGHLTTIFNKVKGINSGFDLTSNAIISVIDRFNQFNTNQDFGDNWTNFINKVSSQNQNVADLFEDLSKQGASAKASIQGVYQAILNGNTKGFNNVKSVIETFKTVNPQNQQDFAKAVGQTNSQLGSYLSNLNGAKASMFGYAGEIVKATAKTIKLQIATVALNTVLYAVAVGLTSWAISGISNFIDNLIETEEEAKEKTEELRQKILENAEAAKEETSKIANLISQYEKFKDVTSLTVDDKESLKSIQDQLVESFGKEAEGIDLVNGKYDEQISKLNKVAETKLAQAEDTLISNRNSAKKNLHSDNKPVVFEESSADGNLVKLINEAYPGMISAEINDKFFGGKVVEVELYGLTSAQQKVEAIQAVLEKMKSSGYEDIPLFTSLTEKRNEYQQSVEAYNNSLYDLADNYISLYSLDNPIDITKSSSEIYQSWKEGLLKQFENDKEIQSAIEHQLEQTLSNVPRSVTPSINISEFIQSSINEYSEQISDFISEKEKIDAALKEQEENGGISIKTAFDLSTSGYQSAIQFDRETNSYKLLRKEIDKVAKSRRAELKAKLESEKSSLIKNNSDEFENWRKNTGRTKDDVMYQAKLKEYNASVQGITSSYDLYISMLEKADFATNDFSDTVSKTNQDIEKYSENISKISNSKSIVKSAQEEQEKFGRLSIDTIKSLHEAGLSGAMSYNEMTGETYLLVDAVDELTRAQIENQKVDINKSITETTNKIAEASERLRNIGNPSDAYTANMVSGLNQNIAQWQSQLDELGIQKMELGSLLFSFETDDESTKQSAEEAAEKAAEEYANAVKEAFNKEESELDHLKAMDVINEDTYYDSLAKIVKKYYSDKEMFLDEYRQYEEKIYDHLKQKQIDAIQEQIDALKSVNEEKQEEIDLEKAKQALENAKRNKTISVYDSERGWIHETDRKAIDTAQKEYDDLVLNEKIEALESMIDTIENGTNTIHSLDESVDVIQQVDGMVDLTKYFKNVDAETLNEMTKINQSIYNGAGIPESLTNQFDKTIAKDSYVVNDNKTINLNGVTVKTDDPERFVSQMEQIANKSFDTKFMPAMNNLAEDIKRHRANHRYY